MSTIRQITEQMITSKEGTRLSALLQILQSKQIEYKLERLLPDGTNVVVSFTEQPRYTILVAHYDIVSNSLGINDNTLSVALLIQLAERIKASGSRIPLKIIFADKEESGMIGSQAFAESHRREIDMAIVLDIIGHGDCLVYGTYQRKFFDWLYHYDIIPLKTVMPSDNLSFERYQIPNVLITAIHRGNIRFTNGGYELQMPLLFLESMHGGPLDNRWDVINFDLVNQLSAILLSLVSNDKSVEILPLRQLELAIEN